MKILWYIAWELIGAALLFIFFENIFGIMHDIVAMELLKYIEVVALIVIGVSIVGLKK